MKISRLFAFVMIMIMALMIVPETYAQEEEQGELVWIITDNVSPANMAEYESWIKQFKAIADETGGPNYGAGQDEEGISYFINVGKTMAGYDEVGKKFEEWFAANPKLMELDTKYGHLRNFTKTSVWRHSPSHSYIPEGYEASTELNYTRVDSYWIKSGSVPKAYEIIGEYIVEMKNAGIGTATNAYWNVFGEEQACIAFVSSYENRDAWLSSEKEIYSKMDETTRKEMQGKWSSILRKYEQSESWNRSDLAHFNK